MVVSLAVFDLRCWISAAAIVACLAILGWYGAHLLGRYRWIPLGTAALMAMPLAIYLLHEVHDRFVYERTLDHDETVTGLPLYAGSRIRFEDPAHTVIRSVNLSRVTHILGVPFTGRIRHRRGGDSPGVWAGTLAVDQSISGWLCSGRCEVIIRYDGTLSSCQLATAHTFFDYELPAGTQVAYDPTDILFALPSDKELAIKALSTTAPGGVTLTVTGNGRLKEINGLIRHTIVVHSLPLKTPVVWSEEAVSGRLAEPLVVGGERRPEGTAVRIDLVAGTVSLAGANWWLSE